MHFHSIIFLLFKTPFFLRLYINFIFQKITKKNLVIYIIVLTKKSRVFKKKNNRIG